MTYEEEWALLHARIIALKEAAALHMQMLAVRYADEMNVGGELLLQQKAIVADLETFARTYEAVLPNDAMGELNRFLRTKPVQGIKTGANAEMVNRAGPPALVGFASGFQHLLAGRQERLRLRSARAFEHLQRMLAVDVDFRKKWMQAFDVRGETSCEQLGAVHLLGHGIFAFKIDSHGARTDLVFDDPLDVAKAARSSEGLVLTEWKVARKPAEVALKFNEARKQVDLYKGGPLSGLELAGYRYLVVVTETQAAAAALPAREKVGGVEYVPVNIAITPRTPSKQAKKK